MRRGEGFTIIQIFLSTMGNGGVKTSFSVGIGLFIIVIITIGAFFLSSRWKKSKTASSVVIEGLYILDESTLLSEINLTKEAILKIGSMNLTQLEDTLMSHHFTRSAEAVFSEIGQITIRIQEKVPEFLVLDSHNRLYYVDRTMEQLSYERYSPYYDLPIVRGITNDSTIDSSAFRKVLSFCDIVGSADKERNGLEGFSEINYHKGSISALLANTPCLLKIGTWSDDRKMAEKIASAIKFVEKKGLINKTIDLRWEQMVVVN